MKFIVNADDYGLNKSCTNAILVAFRNGIVTDTTACANGEYIYESIELAREAGIDNKIGIHFNITTGFPVTDEMKRCPRFCDKNGMLIHSDDRYSHPDACEKKILYNELIAQYKKLSGYGIKITHGDSHHHIHTAPAFAGVFRKAYSDCNIRKVRIMRNIGSTNKLYILAKELINKTQFKRRFVTADYFGSMSDMRLLPIRKNSVAEVMVHPDYKPGTEIMIDRVKYTDGIPQGKKITSLSERYPDWEIEYTSYPELK